MQQNYRPLWTAPLIHGYSFNSSSLHAPLTLLLSPTHIGLKKTSLKMRRSLPDHWRLLLSSAWGLQIKATLAATNITNPDHAVVWLHCGTRFGGNKKYAIVGTTASVLVLFWPSNINLWVVGNDKSVEWSYLGILNRGANDCMFKHLMLLFSSSENFCLNFLPLVPLKNSICAHDN